MMLSGEVTSTYFFVSVSNHCGTCVATIADTSVSSPTTMHMASNTCANVIVSVFAPRVTSRCQVRSEGRVNTPLFISVMFTD